MLYYFQEEIMTKKYIGIFLFVFIALAMPYADYDDDFWLSWCMGFVEYYTLYDPASPEKDVFTYIFDRNPDLKNIFDSCKKDLEPIIIEKIGLQDTRYVLLAAYYKCPSFVEPLISYFVNYDFIYLWEGPNYEMPDAFLSDYQYPIQNLCIDVIEDILNVSIVDITLTDERYTKLYSQYSKHLPIDKNDTISAIQIDESLIAYWKLKKLGYDVTLYK
jgi:hypothetical protein